MTTEPREVPLYDQFGGRYDLMVDWAGRIARESPFFEGVFAEVSARRVLDVGSATGFHAARFAELGLETVGAEPSGELLRIARERFAGAPRLDFVPAGLGELRRSVSGEFDVVTCIGNTLPHLPDDAALRAALADVAAVLRPGGRLVVQQLNYDRILAARQRFLGVGSRRENATAVAEKGPVDKAALEKEYLFFRFYDFGEGVLTFNLATFERTGDGDWGFRVDSTSLQPITAGQLAAALDAAEFDVTRLLADYAGQAFDPGASGDLVVIARRR